MEKIKRKDGIKFREKIYIDGKEFKGPVFDRKGDATAWKSVKLAEKRQFLATGVMPVMRPVLDEVKFRKFAQWWLDTRVQARSTKRTVERYDANLKTHIYPWWAICCLRKSNENTATCSFQNLEKQITTLLEPTWLWEFSNK